MAKKHKSFVETKVREFVGSFSRFDLCTQHSSQESALHLATAVADSQEEKTITKKAKIHTVSADDDRSL